MSLNLHLLVKQQYNMDAIDITDSAFSLDVSDVTNIINTENFSFPDYNILLYIGVVIIIAVIGIFLYKFYQNKTQDDCEGGFCTMNNNTNREI